MYQENHHLRYTTQTGTTGVNSRAQSLRLLVRGKDIEIRLHHRFHRYKSLTELPPPFTGYLS